MFSAIVAPFRRIVSALVAAKSPNALAAGFTLGLIIGLVPKGNLIALSLCVLLFSLRCNKGLALVAAVLISCVTMWTDPIAHKIGLAVLSLDSMQANYASAMQFPLVPWLGFDNTVVAGSLLIGAWLAYPVYWCTKMACTVFRREAAP